MKNTAIPPSCLTAEGHLRVRVTPNARQMKVEGPVADADGVMWLKLRVATPPEDGKANKAVVKLLAEWLDCPASRLAILSGHTSREKVIRL